MLSPLSDTGFLCVLRKDDLVVDGDEEEKSEVTTASRHHMSWRGAALALLMGELSDRATNRSHPHMLPVKDQMSAWEEIALSMRSHADELTSEKLYGQATAANCKRAASNAMAAYLVIRKAEGTSGNGGEAPAAAANGSAPAAASSAASSSSSSNPSAEFDRPPKGSAVPAAWKGSVSEIMLACENIQTV